jgi:hypothetical protein
MAAVYGGVPRGTRSVGQPREHVNIQCDHLAHLVAVRAEQRHQGLNAGR